tara:strand:+ start:303 stop:758 length:456 start_codon:yes stop_codon:yes gene_type:complete
MEINIIITILIVGFFASFMGFWEKYCLNHMDFSVYYTLRAISTFLLTFIGICLYFIFFNKEGKTFINNIKNINMFQIKLVSLSAIQICLYVVIILYGLYKTKNTTNYLILLIISSIIYIPIINYILYKKIISYQQIVGIVFAILSVILIYY